MLRAEVLQAMRDAGLENPRVILHRDGLMSLFFALRAGPPDAALRKSEMIRVTGTHQCKARREDAEAAIARLRPR